MSTKPIIAMAAQQVPGVTKELFGAYLFAGRIWPQMRGGINISVLRTWIKSPDQAKKNLAHGLPS